MKVNHRKKINVTTAPERKLASEHQIVESRLADEIQRLLKKVDALSADNAKKAARASKLTTELEHARATIAKLEKAAAK